MPFYANCANKVRIIYLGINFTEFKNISLRHIPSEGIFLHISQGSASSFKQFHR